MELEKDVKKIILLSIPLWSDFISQYPVLPLLLNNPFNPTMVWFYLCPLSLPTQYAVILSIPLWSDFIPWCQFCIASCAVGFQSHYGLILSKNHHSDRDTFEQPFNPTMVWFYLLACTLAITKHYSLSIPLWSDFINARAWLCRYCYCCFQSHYGLILSWKFYA